MLPQNPKGFDGSVKLIQRTRLAVVAVIALVIVGLVGGLVTWRLRLAHEVNSRLAALRAAGLPTSGQELNDWYPAVPDSENAALVMTQAFALLRTYPDGRSNEVSSFNRPPRGQPLSPEQKQLLAGYVELNANASAKLREAVKLRKSRYPADFSLGLDTPLSHLGHSKALVEVLGFEAWLAVDSGNPSRAAASIAEMLGTARTLDQEPLLISQFTRISQVRNAASTLEQCLNKGEFGDSELIALTLSFLDAEKTNLITRAFVGERAIDIAYICAYDADLVELANSFWGGTNQPETFGPGIVGGITHIWNLLDLNFFLKATETHISMAMRSPPASLALTNLARGILQEVSRKRHCFSAIFLPGLSIGVIREAGALTSVRAARVALAVERFRLAHGRWPEAAAELVPRFLAAVPADPFDGAPLRYHRLPKGYVIYSVGRDGHDDGGKEAPAPWRSSDKNSYDLTFIVER